MKGTRHAGRPPEGPNGKPRTSVLKIRLTEAERRQLESRAKAEAMDLSPYARTLLFKTERK